MAILLWLARRYFGCQGWVTGDQCNGNPRRLNNRYVGLLHPQGCGGHRCWLQMLISELINVVIAFLTNSCFFLAEI